MRIKKVLMILLTIVMVAGLVACGGQSDEDAAKDETAGTTESTKETETDSQSDEQITITFWDENAGDERTEYYEVLIEKFEEEHPNIKIDYLGLPAADALSKYQTAIQGGETPDVGGINNSWAANIIGQDVCLPLDEFFNDWDQKDNINEAFVEIGKGYNTDGKLYFMPTSTNFITLWINEDMLEEAGLDGPPETWDEFFEYAEVLTVPEKNQYGYTIRGGASSPAIFIDFLYSYSGLNEIFDEDGKCTISDPLHIEFAERYFDMYGKYTPESDITAGWKEIASNFDSGVCAMLTHNLGSYQNHVEAFEDESQFMAYPLPTSVTGDYVNNGSTVTGLSIFNTCENPEAAWEFVSFMSSPEANSYWNESIGQMPVNNSVLDHEWVQEMQHIQTAIETTNLDNCITYMPPAFLPGYASVNSTYIEPAIQSVMAGEMEPAEMLTMWNDHLQEEYDLFMANR